MPERNLRYVIRTMQMDLEAAQKAAVAVAAPPQPAPQQKEMRGEKWEVGVKPKQAIPVPTVSKVPQPSIPQAQAFRPASAEAMAGRQAQGVTAPSPSFTKATEGKPDASYQKPVTSPLPTFHISSLAPPVMGKPTTEAGIELRPIFARPPKLEEKPKEAPKPKGPALRPVFSFTKEYENVPKVPPKRILQPKYIVGSAVAVVIAGLAVYLFAFGGLDTIVGLFKKEPTTPSRPGPIRPPQITQPIQPPPVIGAAFVPVESVISLELGFGSKDLIQKQLNDILSRNLKVGALYQVELLAPGTKQTITLVQFFNALGIVPPFGLLDSLEKDFNLLVEGGLLKNHYVLVSKINPEKAGSNLSLLANQLLSWEGKMVSDFRLLFGQDTSLAAISNVPAFSTATLAGQKVRFGAFGNTDTGIFYTAAEKKNLLLISTSREAMQVLLQTVQSS